MIQNNVQQLSFWLFLVGTYFLPMVGAFLSRQHWPQQITGVINTVLAVAAALVQELIANPDHYHWGWAGVKAVLLWVITFVAHNQTWKDAPKDSVYAKVLAFPRRLPPGGVQPGDESHRSSDVAA
jgi:hypothetical protein